MLSPFIIYKLKDGKKIGIHTFTEGTEFSCSKGFPYIFIKLVFFCNRFYLKKMINFF